MKTQQYTVAILVSGNTIEYDDNGNMTSQADKGILKINL
jgi:hypothetical protein